MAKNDSSQGADFSKTGHGVAATRKWSRPQLSTIGRLSDVRAGKSLGNQGVGGGTGEGGFGGS